MSSPYYLAVDVRRSIISAAVVDESQLATVGANGVQFGSGHTMPTAIHVGPDELAFGEEALTLGRAEPDRLIRDFVSGVEQNNAVFTVEGEEFAAVDLYAWAVDDVVNRVVASRGSRPAGIWTVVPASWDDALIDAVADAFDRDGRRDVEFITAPEALANRYSRVDPSNSDLTLVVCDVGDQALQAAIVRQVPGTRSRRIGIPVHAPISPDGTAPDIDECAIGVVAHALAETGVPIDALYAIVLSGPSDRLEQFRQLLADRFGEPIDVERDPARAAAAGAALALAREKAARSAAATGAGVVATTAAAAAPWYRRPVRVAAIGVGAAALVTSVAVASAFAIGGIGPSETESPASGVTGITPTNQSTLTSPTPSATAQPAPDAAVPAPAPDPVVSDPPTAPVNPRAQVPSAPVVAPAPADPPPVVAPAPDPAPPAEPTPDPEPTVDPTPTPEPTIPVPEPTIPEPEPTIPEPAPTVPEPAPTVPEPEPTIPEPEATTPE